MILMISSLSHKLYLNSLVSRRNIFGSSSKIFGNLRTSSETFGNSRKMFENARPVFGTISENLRKVVRNLRKIIKNAVISMFVYVIAWARGQLRINFTSIFKVFTKLPESRSDEGNLENFENTSEVNH